MCFNNGVIPRVVTGSDTKDNFKGIVSNLSKQELNIRPLSAIPQ